MKVIFLNTGELVLSGNVFIYSKGEIIVLYREFCRRRFTSGMSLRSFPVRSVGMSGRSLSAVGEHGRTLRKVP